MSLLKRNMVLDIRYIKDLRSCYGVLCIFVSFLKRHEVQKTLFLRGWQVTIKLSIEQVSLYPSR
jgi:hypothetical protein